MPIQTVNVGPRGGQSNLYMQGLDKFTQSVDKYTDRIRTRAKNKAINELLGMTPTEAIAGQAIGNDMVSPVTTEGVATDYTGLPQLMTPEIPGQTALDFQQQQLAGFAGVEGISPLEALGMATKQAAPYVTAEQTAADTALKREIAEIGARINPKGFGAITDQYGNTLTFDKDSGLPGTKLTTAGQGGVNINSKTPTIALPTGSVYTAPDGTPLVGKDGNYIYKTTSTIGREEGEVVAQEQATLDAIAKTRQLIKDNPDALGSVGSSAFDFIGNAINDILKIPTRTRLARNEIKAKAGVIATNLRSMNESGVMTESDFIRYQSMVPAPDDSPAEANNKLNTLAKELLLFGQRKHKVQGTKAPVGPVETDTSTTVDTDSIFR